MKNEVGAEHEALVDAAADALKALGREIACFEAWRSFPRPGDDSEESGPPLGRAVSFQKRREAAT
jgi:hypothetical protein